MPEMQENPPKIITVFLDAVIQFFDVGPVEKAQNSLL